MKKHLYLSEQSLKILADVKEKNQLSSESAAIEYILRQYAEQENMEDTLGRVMETFYDDRLRSIEHIVRESDRNLYLLLDCMNTLLIERGYSRCFSFEREPGAALEQARENLSLKLERQKQLKDNLQKKRGWYR